MVHILKNLYGYEDPEYPICVNIMTGSVITSDDCPILWVSNLQIEVFLLTLHYDYVVLSKSLRGVLPLNSIIKEVIVSLNLDV